MMQQASATDPAPGRRPELVPEPDVEAARVAWCAATASSALRPTGRWTG
jgi:hypothetical protein